MTIDLGGAQQLRPFGRVNDDDLLDDAPLKPQGGVQSVEQFWLGDHDAATGVGDQVHQLLG